jgi:hypothetical protein
VRVVLLALAKGNASKVRPIRWPVDGPRSKNSAEGTGDWMSAKSSIPVD